MLAATRKGIAQLLPLIAVLFCGTPASANETLVLNFGVFSNDSATTVVRSYMPTLKVLETSMEKILNRTVDIRMHIAAKPKQGSDQLIQGNVDFASLDTTSYITVKKSNPELRVLAGNNSMNSNVLTPWVARSGLHDSIFVALRESLFSVKNSKVLTSLKTFGFVQSHDAQYSDSNDLASLDIQLNHKHEALDIPTRKQIAEPEPTILGAQLLDVELEKNRTKNTQSDSSHYTYLLEKQAQ